MGFKEVDLQNYSYLFLDRDGTINKKITDGYVKYWKDFYFLPGALEAIYHFTQVFERIIIVTNQQGIGKELMTHEELQVIHGHMLKAITNSGGKVDEIYYCPHLNSFNPWCRKPNPGMVEQAKKDFPEIEFNRSVIIGDGDGDIQLGINQKMLTVRIVPDDLSKISNIEADFTVHSMLEFYQLYLKNINHK